MVYCDEKPYVLVQSCQLLGGISFLHLLKMEVAGISKMFEFIYKITCCHAPNTEFYYSSLQNLKSRIKKQRLIKSSI